jgi:transposase
MKVHLRGIDAANFSIRGRFGECESMGLVERDDGWRIPDVLWAQIEHLLPPGKEHPLGCHNPRVPDRNAMNAILFVLRTGCQWNALNATGICKSSSAHRRFVEWTEAGVFEKVWVKSLGDYEEFVGIDWSWLSMDGAMSKAPLGGKKNGSQPHRQGQERHQAQPADRRRRRALGRRSRRSEPQRLQAGA